MPAVNMLVPGGVSSVGAGGDPINYYPIDAQPWTLIDRWMTKVRQWKATISGVDVFLDRESSITNPAERINSETDLPCKHARTTWLGSTPDADEDLAGTNCFMSLVANVRAARDGIDAALHPLLPITPATGLTWAQAYAGAGSFRPMLWIEGFQEITGGGVGEFESYTQPAGDASIPFLLDDLPFDGFGGVVVGTITIVPVLFWTHGGKFDEITGALL